MGGEFSRQLFPLSSFRSSSRLVVHPLVYGQSFFSPSLSCSFFSASLIRSFFPASLSRSFSSSSHRSVSRLGFVVRSLDSASSFGLSARPSRSVSRLGLRVRSLGLALSFLLLAPPPRLVFRFRLLVWSLDFAPLVRLLSLTFRLAPQLASSHSLWTSRSFGSLLSLPLFGSSVLSVRLPHGHCAVGGEQGAVGTTSAAAALHSTPAPTKLISSHCPLHGFTRPLARSTASTPGSLRPPAV
jgi:hypothetical protein